MSDALPPTTRYADHEGPERDPLHSLDDWTAEKCRADMELDAAIAAREDAERATCKSAHDVYEVADAVLAPLRDQNLQATPDDILAAVRTTLRERGARLTRKNMLEEAARVLAQQRAANDPELALALLLRAALMFKPEAGWQTRGQRARTDGFATVSALLTAAFCDLALGAGALSFEVAENRARTRSLPGEIFVQETHSSAGRAKNSAAIERSVDAQRIIAKTGLRADEVHAIYEVHVLGRHKKDVDGRQRIDRESIIPMLRARRASRWGIALPPRPVAATLPKKASDGERLAARLAHEQATADWYLAAGLALHGPLPPMPDDAPPLDEAATVERARRYVRRHDAGLVAAFFEADDRLKAAIGQAPPRAAPRGDRPRPAPVRASLPMGDA